MPLREDIVRDEAVLKAKRRIAKILEELPDDIARKRVVESIGESGK